MLLNVRLRLRLRELVVSARLIDRQGIRGVARERERGREGEREEEK